MLGKGALIVILGFSIVFGVAGRYWSRNSTKAVENFVDYYDNTAAHNIAVSAANLAADSIFQNPANASMATLSGEYPGGGKYTARCDQQPGNRVLVTAVGLYPGMSGQTIFDTVQVLLAPSSFARYAWFTDTENGVNWVTGDTLTGDLQTNSRMYVIGQPVIKGAVSTFGGAVGNGGSRPPYSLPDRYGDRLICDSYQTGVKVPLPSDISNTVNAATKIFQPASAYSGSGYAYNVYLQFNSDGTVTYSDSTWQKAYYSGWTLVDSTPSQPLNIASIGDAGTGGAVILVNNGNAHVSGTVSGRVTVAANKGNGTYKESIPSSYDGVGTNGNVFIDGATTCSTDPRTNPGSPDMLGLVAYNDVMLMKQPNGDVNIDAAVFALKGSFLYQNYGVDANDGDASGYIQLYGSITQENRGPVGRLSTGYHSSSYTGFLKNYRYDPRMGTDPPPGYPGTNRYRVIAWRE